MGLDDYFVRFNIARRLLRMANAFFFLPSGIERDVLRHVSSERDGHHLNATADAQQRHASFACEARKQQFAFVALWLYFSRHREFFFALPMRVAIAAAAED